MLPASPQFYRFIVFFCIHLTIAALRIDALFIRSILTLLLMRASVSTRDESLTESLDTTISGDKLAATRNGREGSPLLPVGYSAVSSFACVSDFVTWQRHPVTRYAVGGNG